MGLKKEPTLTNTDCVGQNEIRKVESSNYFKSLKHNIENCKTGDYKESDYIEKDNFTSNVRIGEPKVSADKEQNPNNSYSANNGSHCECNHELFCVTGKDSDFIDIEDLF